MALALVTSLCFCSTEVGTMINANKDPDLISGESLEKIKGQKVITEYVMYQFKDQYPDAKKAQWEAEIDSYTVKFLQNNLPAEIMYSDRAVVISEHIGQPLSSLGPKITKHCSKSYPEQKVLAVYRNYANKQRSISLVLNNQTELYYELSGQFIREEKP